MTVDAASYIYQLDETLPTSADLISEGDDHIRTIKKALKATFPNVVGVVTVTHANINSLAGVTGAIQTQLNTKASKHGDVYSGDHDFGAVSAMTVPEPPAGDQSQKPATTAFVAATAFSSILPGQSGNAGKVLGTNGTAAAWVSVDKSALGLGNVDNTSDANKPVSTATASAISNVTTQVNARLPLTGGVMTGPITSLRESAVTLGGTASLNLSSGNVFSKTITGPTTFTVSSAPSAGQVMAIILDLINGGSAQLTWWPGVRWPGGAMPSLTTAGRDVLGFLTYDGGANWSAFLLGRDVR